MKKSILALLAVFTILFSAVSPSSAQERNPGQKSHIIITGEKFGKPVIDTLYKLSDITDTLKLSGACIIVYKDGKTGEKMLMVSRGMHRMGPMAGEPMGMRKEVRMERKDSIGPEGRRFERIVVMEGEGNMEGGPCMMGKERGMGCGQMHRPEGMCQGKGMTPPPADKDVVFFNLSIDGVMVNVTAPKEKSKEVDLIINDIQKILNTGK